MTVFPSDLPDDHYQGVYLTLPIENKVSPWRWFEYKTAYVTSTWGNGFEVPYDGFNYYLTHASVWSVELVYSHFLLYNYTHDYTFIDIRRSYYSYRGSTFRFPQKFAPVGHAGDFFQSIFWPVTAGTYHFYFCQSGYRVPGGE